MASTNTDKAEFNTKLSRFYLINFLKIIFIIFSIRRIVETAFGQLVQRFRRFMTILEFTPEKNAQFILAALILHNMHSTLKQTDRSKNVDFFCKLLMHTFLLLIYILHHVNWTIMQLNKQLCN
jgi:hypothetical protein